jgi:hypothetical protein
VKHGTGVRPPAPYCFTSGPLRDHEGEARIVTSSPPLGETPRGTALVPTATSFLSRSPTTVDTQDVADVPGHIDRVRRSAGGRKVAGSNPVAPTKRNSRKRPVLAPERRERSSAWIR